MFANLIFDLDGTLVDSLPGIESSLRAALVRCQPGRTLDPGVLRPRVGPPLAGIIAGLWPDLSPEETAALMAAYRAHYLEESCAATRAFPGTRGVLTTLRAAGRRLFILTNKPAAQTRLILGALGWWDLFAEVSCPDDPAHPFASKQAGASALSERRALDPAVTVLVGDADDDARAAAAAGFAFVGAGFGYGGAGHGISLERRLGCIDTLAELIPLLSVHDHPQRFR